MKLVVGLGNPGKKYDGTRHNVGFAVLDSIVSSGTDSNDWKLMTKASALVYKSGTTLYAKPQTFMNLSGAAVLALMNFYKLNVEDILVVYDDKDLPMGTVRFKEKGSSGGQNGIGNIINVLGTQDIARVKVGIAPLDPDQPISDTARYVLNPFSADQKELLPESITKAKQLIADWL